jgi:RNA polymerase sigma-70 factor (ECF subfamily)
MGENPSAVRREAQWTDLVRRCALHDESALAALYDQSSQLVYTIALRILRDEADSAEVVVDVYRQVWQAAVRFDERRGTAGAWLVILARSRAMDRRRSRIARMRIETSVADPPQVMAEDPNPENLAAANQTRHCVLQALAALPVDQREALDLAFFSGLTHMEIAKRLGEPLGTVKTRIRLGVVKLRDLLRGSI